MFMQLFNTGAFDGTNAAKNIPENYFINLEECGFDPEAIEAMTIHQSGSSLGGSNKGDTANHYRPTTCTNANGEGFKGIKITARTTHLTLCGLAGTNVPTVDM
jgi:hypothetical protein